MMRKQNRLNLNAKQWEDYIATQVNKAYENGEISAGDVTYILNKLGVK